MLCDNVVHWNIVPSMMRKKIYMEKWGNQSTKMFLDVIQNYFNTKGESIDWKTFEGNKPEEKEVITPTDKSLNHAFSTWKQYSDTKNKAWRIQEIVHIGQSVQPSPNETIAVDISNSDLLIIQDWGMNIRNYHIDNLSMDIKDTWVLYRSFPPLFTGDFWGELQKGLHNNAVIILRADDLRKLNTSISKGLSWEQTIQDIINEIYFKQNISLHALRSTQNVIISFGCTGTLLIQNDLINRTSDPKINFFFDSMGIEGYWEQAHPGYLPGDLELLLALLSKEILFKGIGDEEFIFRAIRAHLFARRSLHLQGANVEKGSLQLDLIQAELEKVYGSKTSAEFSPVGLDFSLFSEIYRNNKKQSISKDWSLLGMTKWDLYSFSVEHWTAL